MESVKTFTDQVTDEKNILFVGIVFMIMYLIDISFRFTSMIFKFRHTETNDFTNKQWIFVSLIVTSYLGIGSLIRHGYMTIYNNSCSNIDTFDTQQIVLPFASFIAYLWYDMLFNNISKIYKIHHIICSIPVMYLYMVGDVRKLYLIDVLLQMELSTIILNLKLLTSQKNNNILTFVFILSFLCVRPLHMPFILIKMFECLTFNTITNIIAYFSFTILWIVNIYWTLILFKKIRNDKKKKIH